jgi:hypothetical protein
MFNLGTGLCLPRFDPLQRVAYLSGFHRGQDVVAIIHNALGLDKHAVGLLGERHEITFLQAEGFEDLSWDDHFAPLAYAANRLFSCGGCLRWHVSSLSDS